MFTDPTAQVVFQSPKSGTQWMMHAPDYPFLTGVTLAFEMERKATLQLNFDAPYDDAIGKLLCRGTPLTLGVNVKARIGYASRPDWFTPWFGGFLNAGGDGLTIDPNGLSGQISVQVVSSGSGYTISRELVQLRESPMATLLACIKAMNLLAEVSLSAKDILNAVGPDILDGFGPIGPGQDPDAFYTIPLPGWSPEACAGLTAWEAVKKICTIANLRFFIGADIVDPNIKANTMYVVTDLELSQGMVNRQALVGSKAVPADRPIPTFRMRGVIDLNTSTFPCLSWAPEGGGASATWLAAGDDQTGKGVLLAYIDPDTNEVIEIPATPETAPVATVGPQPAVQQDLKGKNPDGTEDVADEKKQDGTPAVVVSAPMPPGQPGARRALMEAQRRQMAGNPAQQGVLNSIGIPWMAPSLFVNLAGCGEIFDGLYLVKKATHTWTGGSYDMSLTGMRQGRVVPPEGEQKTTPAGTNAGSAVQK